MDILSNELPDPLQPTLSPLDEYEKIDGYHEKPRGADAILDQMKVENEEEQAAQTKIKPMNLADELEAIEAKKRI